MKKITFYYVQRNLDGAVDYLFEAQANPVADKNRSEIEETIRGAVIKRFEDMYQGQIVEPATIEGVLQGGIVWKGLSCTFHAFDKTTLDGFPAEVSISEESPDTICHIEVVFHIAAGRV